MAQRYYGFYSYKASIKRGGGYIYRTPNGETVAVTAVFRHRDVTSADYGFSDAHFVSEVTVCVSQYQEETTAAMIDRSLEIVECSFEMAKCSPKMAKCSPKMVECSSNMVKCSLVMTECTTISLPFDEELDTLIQRAMAKCSGKTSRRFRPRHPKESKKSLRRMNKHSSKKHQNSSLHWK